MEEALEWLDEALQANPRGAEAHNGRGEILWDHGRNEEALLEFSKAMEVDSGFYVAQLNRAELLIEEFHEHDQALDLCDELLQQSLECGTEAEIYYLKAKALFYVDDLDGALFLLRRAIQVAGEAGVYRGFEGQILFELGRFEQARHGLERALLLEPDSAHTMYHMALVLEQLDHMEDAERLFERAADLMPDRYPRPVRISLEEFEHAAQRAIEGLPAAIRRYVQYRPIEIEELPDPVLLRHENLSPQVLGVFLGVPSGTLGVDSAAGPSAGLKLDRIVLFKRNLEKVALSSAGLIEHIQLTIRHEMGHFLGMNEDETERLGLG